MSNYRIEEVHEIEHPELKKISRHVADMMKITAEKVAASFKDPGRYPLDTDAGSLDQILAERFKALPEQKRKRAADKALSRLGMSAAVRQRSYGTLATANLNKAVSIEKQDVSQKPLDVSKAGLADKHLIKALGFDAAAAVAPPGGSPKYRNLELRIHGVRCIDETDGFLGSESGDDEIFMGGSSVDETGDVKKISAFLVRNDFDDNEVKLYNPPKRFTSFDTTEGTKYPKGYFVTLVLSEADNGGFPSFLNKLMGFIKGEVSKQITAAIGGMIGASGGPIMAAVGAAIGYVLGLLINFIIAIWEDDIFPPKVLSAKITSAFDDFNGSSTTPQQFLYFSGHGGKYKVGCDWHLFN